MSRGSIRITMLPRAFSYLHAVRSESPDLESLGCRPFQTAAKYKYLKSRKVHSDYPALERLEGEMINLDGTFRPISANAHAYLMVTVSQAHEQAPEQQMAELEHEEPEEGFGTSQQM